MFIDSRKKIEISLSNEIQKRVFMIINTKCRDYYLTKEKVSLKELFTIGIFNDFFTLKQKVVLLTKLF